MLADQVDRCSQAGGHAVSEEGLAGEDLVFGEGGEVGAAFRERRKGRGCFGGAVRAFIARCVGGAHTVLEVL